MKYLRCIDPTKSLIKGEAYLCRMVRTSRTPTKLFEYDTDKLYEADYVYIQTVYGSHGGNLRVRADRFEEITPQPSLNYMQKQNIQYTIEPVYNVINEDYPEESKIGVSKEEVNELINEYDQSEALEMIEDGRLLISKTYVKDERIVVQEINAEIKITIP